MAQQAAPFAGRRALVTGGSSGIGAATVRAFAAAGAAVVASGRDEDRLEAVRREAETVAGPGAVRTVRADLRDDAEVARLADAAWADGPVDILVNNAGVGAAEPFLDITPEGWRDVLATNLTAPFLLAQHAARRMVAAGGGVIVNVASTDSFVAESPFAHYCVSKAGILQLTRCIAWELGHRGVRCNAVCPGLTATPMVEADLGADFEAAYLPRIPLGRFARPEEQARAILFLASDDASFVNGAALVADGGQLAGSWYHPRFAPPPTDPGDPSTPGRPHLEGGLSHARHLR